jgi:tRNA threonylcarbamoyl adenosine modification protein YeaZ
MNLLALEFSSARRAVVLARMEGGSVRVLTEVVDENFRTVTAMALVDRAMKEGGMAPAKIERIAVGLGPGSYTGIRSALAIAQGWELARGIEVVGVGTVKLIAQAAWEQGARGRFKVVIDAQRQELYVQRFSATEKAVTAESDLGIMAIAAAEDEDLAVGPEAGKWFKNAREIFPSGRVLAEMSMDGQAMSGAGLEPIYLRPISFVKAPAPRVI